MGWCVLAAVFSGGGVVVVTAYERFLLTLGLTIGFLSGVAMMGYFWWLA